MSPGFVYHNGEAFSAKDKDQDPYYEDCSNKYGSVGWWFNNGCFHVLLNGQPREKWNKGCIDPGSLKRNKTYFSQCLKEATMTIRRLNDLCD